jgi:hypothetical protein
MRIQSSYKAIMQKLWIKEVINLFYKQQVIKQIQLVLKESDYYENKGTQASIKILLINFYNVENKWPERRYNFGNCFHKQTKA